MRECYFWILWEKDIRKRGVTWWGVTTHQASTGKGVGKGCPAPLPVLAWWVVTPYHVTHKVEHLFLKFLKYDSVIPKLLSLISLQNITLCHASPTESMEYLLISSSSRRGDEWLFCKHAMWNHPLGYPRPLRTKVVVTIGAKNRIFDLFFTALQSSSYLLEQQCSGH